MVFGYRLLSISGGMLLNLMKGSSELENLICKFEQVSLYNLSTSYEKDSMCCEKFCMQLSYSFFRTINMKVIKSSSVF